jgi:hypothetical protein
MLDVIKASGLSMDQVIVIICVNGVGSLNQLISVIFQHSEWILFKLFSSVDRLCIFFLCAATMFSIFLFNLRSSQLHQTKLVL